MKPTHLRVHRPGGPRVGGVGGGLGGGVGGGAAGGRFGRAGGLVGKSSTGPGAGSGLAAVSSVPRPAGGAFLTPRGARATPAAGAGR